MEVLAYGRVVRKLVSPVPAAVPPSLWSFCMPLNDQMFALWDRLEDRLFKIRNSLNIDGVYRALALFSPPIDPALLVRARAMGMSIDDLLRSQLAAPPVVRFRPLLALASSVAQRAQALGSALLSALERGDGEAIGTLRARQEEGVLDEVRKVRTTQVREAEEQQKSAALALAQSKLRLLYHERQVKDGLVVEETARLATEAITTTIRTVQSATSKGTAIARAAGEVVVGLCGGVVTGSEKVANSIHAAVVASTEFDVAVVNEVAQIGMLSAGFVRRMKEWKHQHELAKGEVKAAEIGVKAAGLRVSVAQQELANHDLQRENARAVREVLESKYSNEALYGWMATELRELYRNATDLAVSIARQAEAAYRRETGSPDAIFIKPTYRTDQADSLLSAERLQADLTSLEHAFLTRTRPSGEMLRDVSVLELDPSAIEQLRKTGVCYVALSEALFDLDAAGDWDRRLRNVAWSVAGTKGTYQNIPLRVSLERAQVRLSAARSSELITDAGLPIETVLSHGQRDTGRFGDDPERFGPFEGLGAISLWRLEVPLATGGFDASKIVDVVFHLQYTSRPGGESVRRDVEAALARDLKVQERFPAVETETGWVVGVALSRVAPDAWYAWRTGAAESVPLAVSTDHMPVWLRDKPATVRRIHLLLVGGDAALVLPTVSIWAGDEEPGAPGEAELNRGWQGTDLVGATCDDEAQVAGQAALQTWNLSGDLAAVAGAADLIVMFELEA